MNKTWLKFLVGLSAIIVAGCAAYFSVTGLGVLFAGAAISVMVMAGSLELAKLVAATYLKQEWDNIKGFNKWYLTISVGTLMIITSAGIFGYLSNAFQQQNLGLQKVERDIAVYQTQITKNESEINRYTTQLNNQQNIRNSQESNLTKQIDKDKSTARVSQMIRNADKEIKSISKRIDDLTKENNIALDSINAIKNANINLEREVGGFRFVAEAFGVPLNTVVKFFIFIIVIVFDPLAVALIIAFNGLLIGKKDDEKEVEVSQPVIDAKDIVAEVSRLRLSNDELDKLEKLLLKKSEQPQTPVPTETPVLTETPIPTETPVPTDTPTPTPIPQGSPTPTPTYLDNINVTARENNFFKTPAEGYTDGPSKEDVFKESEIITVESEEISAITPTEDEESENFSIIEPISENIFQEESLIDESTSSNEDVEKKNLIEFQQQETDLKISEDSEIEEIIPILESTEYSSQSRFEDLYWEKDDINPNQVIYDLENNNVIIPTSEEEIIIPSTPTPAPLKVISRNVSSKRRKFR